MFLSNVIDIVLESSYMVLNKNKRVFLGKKRSKKPLTGVVLWKQRPTGGKLSIICKQTLQFGA